MRRAVTPELLDSDSGTPAEVRASLADLRRINRWFGGTNTTRRMLEKLIRRTGLHEVSLLDVGAGPGESALGAARQLAAHGMRVRVTLLDRVPAHLPRNGNATVVADALALPFAADSFDAVSCSLLAHHLEPEQIVAFVNEALRVSRHAVLLNDLHRSAPHLALVIAGLPLFRSRLTRHDALASVRRAYTPSELRDILRRTSAGHVDISRHYLYRVGVIAWKAPRA